MKLKSFPISNKEYDGFRSLQIKERTGWSAVFSVNNCEEVWPFVCYGPTPKNERQCIPHDEYPLLHDIAGYFIHNIDEMGGRFFINRTDVWFVKGEIETESRPEPFVEWKWDEPRTLKGHLENRARTASIGGL